MIKNKGDGEMTSNCVNCDKVINSEKDDYEIGVSIGEYWCKECSQKEIGKINPKKVYSTNSGVVIETEDKPILLLWDTVDKIAEVSEAHYHAQTIEAFKALVNQKTVN